VREMRISYNVSVVNLSRRVTPSTQLEGIKMHLEEKCCNYVDWFSSGLK
jgi:hypothetical protein